MPQVFRREGEFWTVAYEGRVTRVADARGLHHLARLLANPGQEIHALDLVAGGQAFRSATTDAGPVLDDAAKAAYRARIAELREELDEAEEFADDERTGRARAELQALTDELATATGLGGRDRRAADDAERARVSVTKAIRSALRRIALHDAALAEHLERTVHTGLFSSYQPDPRVPTAWGVADPAPTPSLGTSGAPIVGRAAEQSALRTSLRRPGLVVLVGEPGVGKTRLAADTLAAAATLSMRTAAGRCSDAGERTPYLPFVQVVDELAAALPTTELRAALGEDAGYVAKLAPAVRLLPGIRPPAAVPPELEQRVVLDAVRAFLVRLAAGRGLTIVLDDLHWADEATLLLLEHLAGAPFLIVGTARDEGLEPGHPLARTCERLLRRHAWQEVRLAPLAPPAVAAMLDSLAGGTAPEALARTVVAQAGGNPFFVEHLYRHLVDGATDGVPATIRLVIGHRLDNLPEPARRLLDAAAVLGRECDAAAAAEVAGLDDVLEAGEAGEAAERAHLVVVRADGDDDRITFRHDLVRHTLLAGLSAQRRRRLHARAADALDPGETAAVAGHLLQAGALVPPERTVTALHRAARDALASAAFTEARRLLDLAIERCPDQQQAPLLTDLALAERALGCPDEAIVHWRAALEEFERGREVERTADVCLELGRALENAGRWTDATSVVRRGLAQLPPGPSERRVALLAQFVNSASFAGAFDEAAAALAEARATAAVLGRPDAEGRVLTVRAMHDFTRAAWPACVDAAATALDVVEQSGELYWAGMAGTLLQRALTGVGRLAEASALTPRLDRIGERVGHVFVTHTDRNAAVLDVLATGDLGAFATRTDEDLRRCRSGALRWLADAEAQTGQVAFWRGDPDLALRHLEAGARLEPPGAYRGRYQAPLLRLLAHLGDRDGFRTRWEALADRDRCSVGGRFAALAAAEGLAGLGDREEAAALADEVEEALAAGMVLTYVDLRMVRTVAGLVAAAAGDGPRSDEHFRAAIAQADALPHRIEAAEARRLWGAVLADRGDRAGADALLAEAAHRYRRLRMPHHLARAEGLLARS